MKLWNKKTSDICKLEEKIKELENKIESLAKKKEPRIDFEWFRHDVDRMIKDSIGFLDERMESIIERKTKEFVKVYVDSKLSETKDKLLIEVVKASIGLNRNNDNKDNKDETTK